MKVVARDHLRRLFLIGNGGHRHGFSVHHLEDGGVGAGENQILQFDGPQKVTGLVGDKARINGLFIMSGGTNALHRRFNGHVGFQVDVLRRHNAPGAVLRIAQQRIGKAALLG